jgi:hypothetical protein
MATSFGYVKRDVQDMQINWAEVGQNVRNVLDEESRIRQEKKDAIDKATREYEQRVTDSNLLGEDVEFNKGVLQFSADAQEMILMQDMLLKSGQLKPSDYTIMRQNMVDGTNEVFKTIELFNNERDAVMQGVDNLELSLDNLENFALVQEASNFNKNRIVFDPYSGKVNVANMVEDPNNPGGPLVPDNNPNTLRSVQSLSNIIRDKVDRFDVIASAEEYSKKLAPVVAETVKSMGGTYTKGTIEKITSYFIEKGGGFTPTDAEAKKLIEELGLDPNTPPDAIVNVHRAINQMGESIVSNDRQGMSILIDFAKIAEGGDYITTFNEAETVDANGNRLENVILKKQENGRIIYDLTDEQKKEAKKQWTTQVASFLDESKEVRDVQFKKEPSPTNLKMSKEDAARKSESEEFANMMAQLYYGDGTEVNAAETYFRDLLGATEVKKQGDIVYVSRYNEDTDRVETTPITMLDADGNLMSFDLFAKSAFPGLAGKADIDKAVALGGGIRTGVVKNVTIGPDKTVNITFEGGRVENRPGSLADFRVGSTIELGSMTKTGQGAGTEVSESDKAYKSRYVNAIVDVPKLKTLTKSATNKNLSPADVKDHLAPLEALGFKVIDVITPSNRVAIEQYDGEGNLISKYKFDTNADGLDKAIQGLITHINANMLEEKFEAADVKSVIGPKKSGVPEEGGGSMSGF